LFEGVKEQPVKIIIEREKEREIHLGNGSMVPNLVIADCVLWEAELETEVSMRV
jgi:hypothetical protein